MSLAGALAIAGLLAAPSAHAATRIAAPATPAAPTATLALSASATNRGGIVDVTGTGFAPREEVDIKIAGVPGTAATARSDAYGVLSATGVSVPYRLKPGGRYAITAIGATSKRGASGTFTVQKLTPSISLSATTAGPKTRETVRGTGFGREERITLSLNGAALKASPRVITTTHGAFTAAFTVPGALLQGANTISAIGNESRVSAVAALTGDLPRRTQFYMAGGLNTATGNTVVALLNTNKQPARVYLTLYFDHGATYKTGYITVRPLSAARVAVARLTGVPTGTFGVAVSADRRIAAELMIDRPGLDGAVIPGSAALNTHWYLAGGSTSSGDERVSVLNPSSDVAAHVRMQLIAASGHGTRTITVTAPPHTNAVVDVDRLVQRQGVSIIAAADRPVIVERSQTFGTDGRGLTARAGATAASVEWLFAAGTTANGVQTAYTVLNPGAAPATVTASFYSSSGAPLGSKTATVAPRSRVTIMLNSVAQGNLVAAVITSNQAIVAERAEYTGAPSTAKSGSVVFGRNGAGTRWIFPGGDTTPSSGATPGNDEVLALFNPSATPVTVDATFYDSTGKTRARTYTIAPTAHTVIVVNTLGLTPRHGAVLQATGKQGFIAEEDITTTDGSLFLSTQGLAR